MNHDSSSWLNTQNSCLDGLQLANELAICIIKTYSYLHGYIQFRNLQHKTASFRMHVINCETKSTHLPFRGHSLVRIFFITILPSKLLCAKCTLLQLFLSCYTVVRSWYTHIHSLNLYVDIIVLLNNSLYHYIILNASLKIHYALCTSM